MRHVPAVIFALSVSGLSSNFAAAQQAAVEPTAEPTITSATFPGWVSLPGPMNMAVNAPRGLMETGGSGTAILFCTAKANGKLTDCKVVREELKGMQVGEAALRVSQYFRLRPKLRDGSDVTGQTVTFPIRFVSPR